MSQTQTFGEFGRRDNLIVPFEWLHDFVSDKNPEAAQKLPLQFCISILPTPTSLKAAYKYEADSLAKVLGQGFGLVCL